MNKCAKCGYETELNPSYCPVCGEPMGEEVIHLEKNRQANDANPYLFGMKWYKFTKYFLLPFGIISNLMSLVTTLIPNLKGLDPRNYAVGIWPWVQLESVSQIVLTVLTVAFSAMAMIGLFKMKKYGVKYLTLSYLCPFLFNIIEMLLFVSLQDFLPKNISGAGTMGLYAVDLNQVEILSLAISLAVNLLTLYLLRKYWKKRYQLFQD